MAFAPTELTRALFPDSEDIAWRLQLGASESLAAEQLARALRDTAGWEALRDVLGRIVTDKLPTLVYGDYDVDGSVSSTLLFRWLRSQGVPGNIFLPSRFKHGYGLDSEVMRQAAGQGYRALLALDCGTTNLEQIAIAREGGLICAVIDHHMPKDELPDATLLNPHLEGGVLPPLCTAGLVYACLSALYEEGQGAPAGDELELAGLATIADIVPLHPLNWALGHHSLRRTPSTLNLGLAELVKVSRLHGLDSLTGRQVSFDLVPRLNSAGRMHQARLVASLLQAPTIDEARRHALHLNALNEERRETAKRISEQASAQALDFAGLGGMVVYDPAWHVGVLGIVAARLAETYSRPAIVLSATPGSDGLLSGSVRSFGGVNIAAALALCSDCIESYGGHAMAAGVKVRVDTLDQFRETWSRSVLEIAAQAAADAEGSVTADLPSATISQLTEQFEQEIWALAPYGPDHPVPEFNLIGSYINRVDYMGSSRTHLRLQLSDGQRQARVAGFNMSHLFHRLKLGQQVDAIVECEPDNWNNRCTILLKLKQLQGEVDGTGAN